MSASTIKAIDSTSVHRITSGQVVIDLQTAVKELVENSLDAGATSIEVRFKDYGLKSIEVIDNGHGISPEDYESIALKHHTSKLASFEDLGTVLTFGFRGEALSSLCALSSSVSVTTATADQAPMGTVLDFDRSGKLKDRNGKVARQRGTSIAITGLFAPLAVRRKEFERNAKREYGKALNLLQAYALVPCAKENRGVRLTVSNHPSKGARSVQIRTDGSPSCRASLSSLWGPKSLDNVVVLDLNLEIEPERSSILKKRGVLQEGATNVKVRGLISNFAPGCGRTSSDRQFLYVNGRPCNLSKVQKAFNEVYRSFNVSQVPFLIADFQLPTDSCDINVSPDKRTIFIHSENNLIQALKTNLEETFSQSRSTFSINGASSRSKGTADHRLPASGRGDSPASDSEQPLAKPDSEVDELLGSRGEKDAPHATDNIDTLVQDDKRNRLETTEVRNKSYRDAWNASHSRSSSQSSTGSEQGPVDTDPDDIAEPEPEDVEMVTSDGEDIAAGIPTPDVSLSIEVDEEALSQFEGTLEGDTNNSTQPNLPLFLPSPPAAPQRLRSRASSTSSTRDRTHSPSPAPRAFDESEDRPRKRQRTSSPPVEQSREKSLPIQMVLGTTGASWNLKVQAERGGSELDKREVKKSKTKDTVARDNIRSRLSGFLAPGSQMKPIEVDEEEIHDDGRGDDLEGKELEDQEQSEEEQSETDELIHDDAPDEFPGPTSSNIMSGGRIDLAEDLENDIVDASSVAPQRTEEAIEKKALLQEIVRTSTADLTLRPDLQRLSSTWLRYRSVDRADQIGSPSTAGRLQPAASVANAEDADAAERELARVIHKEDFTSMQILGQFNLGFIIVRRKVPGEDGKHGADDLFIVDQHAADEKYNFETLQQTTKIESQKLIQPRALELTATDELMAIDNVEILRTNGFEVMIDEDACAGQGERVKLVAQPVSKGTTFDMKGLATKIDVVTTIADLHNFTDLGELLHLMQDQPSGKMVRCSKARAMFAMRACRKSVMVGKALTTSQMTSVVRHMGTMDQPWNCPHGRPTMRHLVSLYQMEGSNRPDRNIDWPKFALAA